MLTPYQRRKFGWAAAVASGVELYRQARPHVTRAYRAYKRRQDQILRTSIRRKRLKRPVERLEPRKLDFDDDVEEASIPVTSSTMSGGGIDIVRLADKVGRKRKRSANEIFKSSIGHMEESILRWQNVSESMLGPGARLITYSKDSTAVLGTQNNRVMPVHFMSLTNFSGPFAVQNTGAVDSGARGAGMCRLVYRAPVSGFQGEFGYQYFKSQKSNGDLGDDPAWHYEKGVSWSNTDPSVFHKWTDIRLNLYGAMNYPLLYEVMLVTGMPEDMQILERSPISDGTTDADFPIEDNSPLGDFCRQFVRDLIGNPIVGSSDNKLNKGKMRVIYRKKIYVAALPNSDVTSGSIHTANVKNLNIFVRHDRFRDYSWKKPEADTVYHDDFDKQGWDRTDISNASVNTGYAEVDREERVFMFIKCNAPQLLDSIDGRVNSPVVDHPFTLKTFQSSSYGSYDVVVRNCFRTKSET